MASFKDLRKEPSCKARGLVKDLLPDVKRDGGDFLDFDA